jgi:hypothetical protein
MRMQRFSPRLFALEFALGAIATAAVLTINVYASSGTATRGGPERGPHSPNRKEQQPCEGWCNQLWEAGYRAMPIRTLTSTGKAA